MTNSAHDDLVAKIPHRGRMLWLDEAHIVDGTILARCRLSAAHPFLSGGVLLRSALIEMLSQAAACDAANVAMTEGKKVRQGMLVGIRDFLISGTAQIGETIELRSRRERTFGSMVQCVVEARIDGNSIAQGRMTFHLTLE